MRSLLRALPLAAVAGLLWASPADAAAKLPKDFSSSHWAADATRKAFDYGIFQGYPDGTFRGGQALSHYEAAVVANRLMDQVLQQRVAEDFAKKAEVDAAKRRYADLAAQAKLDADALRAEVSRLKDELEDLKSQRFAASADHVVIPAMRESTPAPKPAAKPAPTLAPRTVPAAPAPVPPAAKVPAKPEEKEDLLGDAMDMTSRKKQKPAPKEEKVAMTPEPAQAPQARPAAPTPPAPKLQPVETQGEKKPGKLRLGAGVFVPSGDAEAGFTWAVNYLFSPTSQRSLMVGYGRADGLEAGGDEVDYSHASLTYLWKVPTMKSKLGYGFGADYSTTTLSTPTTSFEETDLSWHALANYMLSKGILAELRYSGGATDLSTATTSTGGGGISLRILTDAGL